MVNAASRPEGRPTATGVEDNTADLVEDALFSLILERRRIPSEADIRGRLRDDEAMARLLGYVRAGDGWRPVRWRRALTWLKWTFVWRPV